MQINWLFQFAFALRHRFAFCENFSDYRKLEASHIHLDKFRRFMATPCWSCTPIQQVKHQACEQTMEVYVQSSRNIAKMIPDKKLPSDQLSKNLDPSLGQYWKLLSQPATMSASAGRYITNEPLLTLDGDSSSMTGEFRSICSFDSGYLSLIDLVSPSDGGWYISVWLNEVAWELISVVLYV